MALERFAAPYLLAALRIDSAHHAFPTPTKVAQPLGDIEDRITIGVVREEASSSAQCTQPVFASKA